MPDVKSLRRAEIKDGDRGQIDLVFATFNEKDADNDVTLPGAFPDGVKVPLSDWGHSTWPEMGGRLPLGYATMKSSATEARASAQFLMDTPHGSAAFSTIKQLHEAGINTEWSYGYEPKRYDFGEWKDGTRVRFIYEQQVHEISPTLRAVGTGTRVLSVKATEGLELQEWSSAIKSHGTPTSRETWNGAQVLAEVSGDVDVAGLRSMFAYVNPTMDPEFKSAYMFAHHEGPSGPANIRACVVAIATLNNMKEMDVKARNGVYAHLARHLQDAGKEAPHLRDIDGSGAMMLSDELMDALAGVSSAIDSASRVVALRGEKGKSVSHVNTELMEWLFEDMLRLRSLFQSPEEVANNAIADLIRREHGR